MAATEPKSQKSVENVDLGKLTNKVKPQNDYSQQSVYLLNQEGNYVAHDGVEVTTIEKEIRCTEYAPDVFAYIREKLDGITTEKLKEFLNPHDLDNVKAIKKAGEGMGKSGSFFFFSKCDEFLIKTMTMSDFNAFFKMFMHWFKYLAHNPDSLLARIYGVFQVDMEGQEPQYLLLMGNTKKISSDFICKMYDLKGSLVSRVVESKDSKYDQ